MANDHSIAWEYCKANHGRVVSGFTHLPDRADDERQRNRRRPATDGQMSSAKFLIPMDAQKDEDIPGIEHTGEEFENRLFTALIALLTEMTSRDTVFTSRDGFKLAMDVSVYTLIACAAAAKTL